MTEFLENVTFDELTCGRTASITRRLTTRDIELFAAMSGDVNPAYCDATYAKTDMFQSVIGPGLWTGALFSTVLGTILPGPGTIYLEQDLHFRKPVRVGDKVTVTLTVREKHADKPIATFDCLCRNERGEIVVDGTAVVLAPTERVKTLRPQMADIEVQDHARTNALLEFCKTLPPLRTAVVHPVKGYVLQSVYNATKDGLIEPVLVGSITKIKMAAEKAQIDIAGWEIVDAEHSHAAAAKAAELAASRNVCAIMKGSLHTDELLGAILPKSAGLRTERRASHAYFMDVQSYQKSFVITDAVVNIAPDLEAKVDICQNAIDFCRMLNGEETRPKVALLAAVETVSPKMPATIEAAALCKMADRGQITNAILDGPLALDNAISAEAAADKGIISPVSGDPDILVAPNIEAANIAAKQLTFLGNADAAGLVLGARVPIILTSRADSLRTRLLSCALAVKVTAAQAERKRK